MKFVAVFLAALSCLAACEAWTCKDAPTIRGAVKVDAGLGSVVVTTKFKWSYMLLNRRWVRLGKVKTTHATTGLAGTWLIDVKRRVWKLTCGSFTLVKRRTGFTWMDAGGDDHVVGVSKWRRSYCASSHKALAYKSGILGWDDLKKNLKTIACGKKLGCWGTDNKHGIWISKKVNSDTCKMSKWQRVKGSLAMVEVSTFGRVFGVNKGGRLFERKGIRKNQPEGKRWQHIPLCTPIRHVAFDHGKLWVVTRAGLLMSCLP